MLVNHIHYQDCQHLGKFSHLFDELEEDRLQCRRDVHALEQDVAALKKQLEAEPEASSGSSF